MKNLYTTINRFDIDDVVCEELNIPVEIYNMLSGKKGRKLLSQKDSLGLSSQNFSRYDLIKSIKEGQNCKSVVLDGSVKKTISFNVEGSEKVSKKVLTLEVAGIQDGTVANEQYLFVGNKGVYTLAKYTGLKAVTKLDDETLYEKMKRLPKKKNVGEYKNLFLHIVKNEKQNLLDKNVVISGEYPSIITPYIYLNDMVLKSHCSVNRYMMLAKQYKKPLLDYMVNKRDIIRTMKQAEADIEMQID